MTELVLFAFGAAGVLVSGLAVILSRSPLRGALYLIMGLCSSALLYLLLHAPFVAAMQILVYAGAIMVLFVFVIMLLNLSPDGQRRLAYLSLAKLLGTLAMVAIVAKVVAAALAMPGPAARTVEAGFGSVKHVGLSLLTDNLFGFEAISLLLLVAVVGAVVLGLKRLT